MHKLNINISFYTKNVNSINGFIQTPIRFQNPVTLQDHNMD
jgi:hypothetical protein